MRYHDITTADMLNGDGLRVVLWLSACNHYCYNCQNPQTWDTNSGIPFDKSAKEELFRELRKDYISGITLSGGDPLNDVNLSEVLALVNEIRLSFPNKTIWLYSGYSWNDIFTDGVFFTKDCPGWKRREIVKKCDVFVDGEYIDAQRNVQAKWRGSDNQNVIDVQESLKQGKVVLHCE